MTISRLTWSLIAAGSLVLAACGDDAAPGAGTIARADADVTLPVPADPVGTVDGSWVLTGGTADGADLVLLDDWKVTLVVESGEVGGTAACNGYGGFVDVGDGTFAVGQLGWTEMGCEPAVMQLEQAYLAALTKVDASALTGDRLVLTGPSIELRFDPVAPVADAEIVGTTWVLDTYIDGESASNMPMMELATLTLDVDGTLTGSTSCRQLTGEWIVTGPTIQFTSFSAIDDPAAGVCAPESQTLDGLVISVLESGFTAEVDGNRLTLTAPGAEGLSYTSG